MGIPSSTFKTPKIPSPKQKILPSIPPPPSSMSAPTMSSNDPKNILSSKIQKPIKDKILSNVNNTPHTITNLNNSNNSRTESKPTHPYFNIQSPTRKRTSSDINSPN